MPTTHVLDVDLDNLHLCPKECLGTVFWELEGLDPAVDPAFHKEEWFSSTLLEWGPCGKLLLEGDEVRALAQYAPATLFAGLAKFPWARISSDAVFLPYCFVTEGHRYRGFGTELVRTVARDLVDRGYRAVETVADRSWAATWVLPHPFLSSCRFGVVRDHPRHPVMRLDLLLGQRDAREEAEEALPVPALRS
jgi:GNAT superfamily N-acetyltransferase